MAKNKKLGYMRWEFDFDWSEYVRWELDLDKSEYMRRELNHVEPEYVRKEYHFEKSEYIAWGGSQGLHIYFGFAAEFYIVRWS